MFSFLYEKLISNALEYVFGPALQKIEDMCCVPHFEDYYTLDGKYAETLRFNQEYLIPKWIVKIIELPVHAVAIIWVIPIVMLLTPLGAVEVLIMMLYRYFQEKLS